MSKEKFKKYEATKESVNSLISYVQSEKEKLKKNAPQALADKAEEFYQFLKSFDVEALRPELEVPTGDFFDIEDLKKRIQEHTGYIWKVTELTGKNLEDRKPSFDYHYNLKVENLVVYEFYRDAKSRSELWLLTLFLMPGCALLQYATDRVSGGTGICKTPDELMKVFERNCG